jgi:outer membrane protein
MIHSLAFKTKMQAERSMSPRCRRRGVVMRKVSVYVLSAAFTVLLSHPVLAAETVPVAQPKAAAPENKSTTEAVPAKPVVPSKPASVFTGGPEQPAKVKIGYVDMPTIAKDSVPGKAAYAEMKTKSEKIKERIEAKQKDLEKQKAAIEAKLATLSPKERNVKAKEFQKKLEDFQKYVQKAQKDLQTRENELLGNLFKSIEKVVGEYGKAHGYAEVADKKGILFVGDNVEVKDLTEEVIKLVNSEQVKK